MSRLVASELSRTTFALNKAADTVSLRVYRVHSNIMAPNGVDMTEPPNKIFDTLLCLDFGSQYVRIRIKNCNSIDDRFPDIPT